MIKTRRQMAIMEIISDKRVETQEDLCAALLQLGFRVTQATVSRDIKDLKLVKVADYDGYRYAMPEAGPRTGLERMKRIFQDAVTGMDESENLIIIKTLPGTAHAVAATIDGAGFAEVLGTVAGDDTIMVVVKPRNAVPDLMEKFSGFLS